MPSRLLRAAAPAELISLALLLINLATVHLPAVASLFGPVHGCAYLFVIGATIRESRDTTTRLLAIVPGIGGLLVIRKLRTEPTATEPTAMQPTATEPSATDRADGVDTTTRRAGRADTTTRRADQADTTTRRADQADTTTRRADQANTTTRQASAGQAPAS